MTSSGEQHEHDNGGEQRGGLLSQLGDAAKGYAVARGQDAAKRIGEKVSGVTGNLNETADGGGFKAAAAGGAVQRLVSGESPVKAALGGVGAGIKEKVSGLFGRKKSGGSGNKKFMNIIEDITVGVPVDVAYDQWTQFQEFASFMKGVESVDQTDELNSNWRVKVAKSRRNFKATVTEQIPDRKIAWTTEGAKGTVKGTVTFHPLADDLTQILLVMEYYPQGLFEKTGNIWRAQGRRTRLDLKHFRRFIMQRGEATGSWRGEIRDGEVVRGPDEEEPEEQQPEDTAEDQSEDEESEEPSEDGEDEYEDAAEYEDDDEDFEDEDEEPDEDEDEVADEGAREPEPAGAR
jgi:uncharacterized membrane protein